MDLYFCKCLNIVVNVKESDTKKIDGRNLISFSYDSEHEQDADKFFLEDLFEVTLNYSGIELTHKFLTNERCFGDWLVTSCLNCGTETHAIHAVKQFDRVLLNSSLQHGKTTYNEIKRSNAFSKLFKIVNISNDVAVDFGSKFNVSEAKNEISAILRNALIEEEDAMNERIRIFKEKQQQQFQEFKLKSYKQKEEMIKKIQQYEESISHDSLFDTINESYFGSSTSESRDVSTDLPQIKGSTRSIPFRLDNNPMSRSFLNQSKPKNTQRFSPVKQRSYSENSDDTLFDLDEFQGNKSCEPFYESDEDSSGDATSLESSGGYNIPSRNSRPGDRVYATSMPVNVPLFRNNKHSYDPESDDEEVIPPSSPSHIAESIQAIARSMNDSTSMFGELPRPRLNSQPYSFR